MPTDPFAHGPALLVGQSSWLEQIAKSLEQHQPRRSNFRQLPLVHRPEDLDHINPPPLRLVVADLTDFPRREWAPLLTRLERFPLLHPTSPSRLALHPRDEAPLGDPKKAWEWVPADEGATRLSQWLTVEQPDDQVVDRLLERAGMSPLASVVDRACMLLDTWKLASDRSQVIHPLNAHLQYIKSLILDGVGWHVPARAFLIETCRKAFTTAVMVHDERWKGPDAGRAVKEDFFNELDEFTDVPPALNAVAVRPGELLAILLVLLAPAHPSEKSAWPTTLVSAEPVPGLRPPQVLLTIRAPVAAARGRETVNISLRDAAQLLDRAGPIDVRLSLPVAD